MEITKKQLNEIERILGYPLTDLLVTKRKRTLDLSGLPESLQHQIQDVLNTEITIPSEEAIRIVRQGLKERVRR